MNTAKIYHDSEGNELSIVQMVKYEPEWAANRVQEGEKAIDMLQAVAEQLEEAAHLIAEWGNYAEPYFQEKHDLNGDISKFKTYAALIRKQTGV